MAVRLARAEDLPALMSVEDAFARAGVSRWALIREHTFRTKVAHDEVYLAPLDEGIAGYLMFTLVWGYPWIEYVRLFEDRRRQGIGTELVRALEERLRGEGYRMMFSSVTGGDEAAMAWHTSLGFELAGHIDWSWTAPQEVVLYKGL